MDEAEKIRLVNNIRAATLNIVIKELEEVSEIKYLQRQKNWISKWRMDCAIGRLKDLQKYLETSDIYG